MTNASFYVVALFIVSAPLSSALADKEMDSAQFKTDVALRTDEGKGLSIGVFGGAIAFQDGTLRITSPAVPGAELDGNTRSRVGGVAGVTIESTYSSSVLSDNMPDWLLFSIGGDYFWTGYNYKAVDATFGSGGSLTADVNTFSFMLDPKVKFRIGPFHPYIGFGVGGTYINAGNAQVTVPGIGSGKLNGSSDDVDFSFEGIAGAEYFFNQHWAMSVQYRYLYILDPTLKGDVLGAPVKYHLDNLDSSLFTAGVSYYF